MMASEEGISEYEFKKSEQHIKGYNKGYNQALEDVLKEIIDLYDSGMTGLYIRKYCVERVEALKSEVEE